MRQLETSPVGTPVLIRISGDDIGELRAQGEKLKDIFRSIPTAERIQDDWGVESFVVTLHIDPDRANLAGVTNADVAVSSAMAMNAQMPRSSSSTQGSRTNLATPGASLLDALAKPAVHLLTIKPFAAVKSLHPRQKGDFELFERPGRRRKKGRLVLP